MNYTGSRTYKDKTKIRKPREEWIRVNKAHEPFIAKEIWEAVQQVNKRAREIYSPKKPPEKGLFSGKLVCADCGA